MYSGEASDDEMAFLVVMQFAEGAKTAKQVVKAFVAGDAALATLDKFRCSFVARCVLQESLGGLLSRRGLDDRVARGTSTRFIALGSLVRRCTQKTKQDISASVKAE